MASNDTEKKLDMSLDQIVQERTSNVIATANSNAMSTYVEDDVAL